MTIPIDRKFTCAAAFAAFSFSPVLLAGEVPILEVTPADAAAIVYIPSLDRLEQQVEQMAEGLGLLMPMSVREMRMTMGLDAGFDSSGPMGIILNDLSMDAMMGGPSFSIVLSVDDYDAMVQGFGGEPGDDVSEIEINYETLFVKNLGRGFAALAPQEAMLDGLGGEESASEQLHAKLGQTVSDIAEDSAMSILVLDMVGLGETLEQANQMAMMMNPAMAQQGSPMDSPGMKMLMESSDAAVIGLDSSPLGVSILAGATFKPGTELRKLAADADDGGTLFRSLPNEPFLLAFAADAGTAKFMQAMTVEEQAPNPMTHLVTKMQGQWNGIEGAFYVSPGGSFMMGMLTRGVMVMHSDNAEGLFNSVGEAMGELDGMEQEGIKFSTKFEPGKMQIAGRDAAAYQVNMRFPPEMAQMMQGMAMMYGGPGPNGLLVAGENGLIQTVGRDAKLVESTLSLLDNGEGESLGMSAAITQIGQQLPAGRNLEAYLGIGEIIGMVKPMAAMFLPGVELPDSLPPIGMGLAFTSDGVHTTTFVPQQVIQSVYETVQAINEATSEMGGEEDWEDWEEEEEI
jgi:hypothetical protein